MDALVRFTLPGLELTVSAGSLPIGYQRQRTVELTAVSRADGC